MDWIRTGPSVYTVMSACAIRIAWITFYMLGMVADFILTFGHVVIVERHVRI